MVKKRQTVAEFVAELARDPDYQARRRRIEADTAQRLKTLQAAQAPLVAALAQVDIKIDSVWDLVNTKAQYPAAVPILVEHLTRPYPDAVLEGIIRALAIPESKRYWKTLMRLFEEHPGPESSQVKDALALALSAAADDTLIDDVIRLVQVPSHGGRRIVLLNALATSSASRAHAALNAAASDPQLSREARFQLRRHRQHIRRTALFG